MLRSSAQGISLFKQTVASPRLGELGKPGDNMKALGVVLLVAAALLLIGGATLDIGRGGYANLSLMNARSNLFIVGGFSLLGGIICFAMGGHKRESEDLKLQQLREKAWKQTTSEKQSPGPNVVTAASVEDTKVCPRCAETIKRAALVCRFCQHEFAASLNTAGVANAGELASEPQPIEASGLERAALSPEVQRIVSRMEERGFGIQFSEGECQIISTLGYYTCRSEPEIVKRAKFLGIT